MTYAALLLAALIAYIRFLTKEPEENATWKRKARSFSGLLHLAMLATAITLILQRQDSDAAAALDRKQMDSREQIAILYTDLLNAQHDYASWSSTMVSDIAIAQASLRHATATANTAIALLIKTAPTGSDITSTIEENRTRHDSLREGILKHARDLASQAHDLDIEKRVLEAISPSISLFETMANVDSPNLGVAVLQANALMQLTLSGNNQIIQEIRQMQMVRAASLKSKASDFEDLVRGHASAFPGDDYLLTLEVAQMASSQ